MPDKYGYIGQVDTSQLLEWFLFAPSRSPLPVLKKTAGPSKERRLSNEQADEMKRQEAWIRRFRLTAKHKRARLAYDGPNKRPGITSKDEEKSKDDGTQEIAGVSASSVTRKSTAKETKRYWLATRICGHCNGRGLWSKGSTGQCPVCRKFTDLM